MAVAMFHTVAYCQFYVEPLAGIQKDMNNSSYSFFNSGLRATYKIRRYEMVLQFQKSWPYSWYGTDPSFTLDTLLPVYSLAGKQIKLSSFSFAFGNRFKVIGNNQGSCLFISFYTGVMFQKASVIYSFDKNHYTILNPDQSQDLAGLFASGGLEYMWQFKKGRIFAELNFSTPPAGNWAYPASFGVVSPLSFNVGYSFKISKK